MRFELILMAWVVPLTIIGVCIPLLLNKVPPNRYYGFRTGKTLSSEEIWYPANRFGAQCFVVAGAVGLIAGAAAVVWLAHVPRYTVVLALAFANLAAVLAASLVWWLKVRRM